MTAEKITTWWLQPRDNNTNETISEALSGLFSRECASERVECADGEKRDLWRVLTTPSSQGCRVQERTA